MRFYSGGNLFIILAIIFLTACQKDRPSPSWEVELLTPLIADTIDIEDVLDSDFFTINPDGTVSLVFDDELYHVNVDSLVELPDTLFSWGFGLEALPNPITLQPGDTIIKEVFDWPLDIDSYDIKGVKLVEALIRSGQIVFEAFDQSGTDLEVVFGINSAIRNETDTFLVAEKVLKDEVFSMAYDVSDYKLNLTGNNGDTINMLNYYLALIVHPDEPGPVTLFPADSFAVNIYFEQILVNYALGYFGQNTFYFGPESYPFDFFEGLDVAGLSIENADVNLRIENYYGVEAHINIQDLTARNNQSGLSVSLAGDIMGSDLFIDRATDPSAGMGIVEPHTEIFDFSDTNFPEVFSILPDEISYTMTLQTNVLADSTNYNNFLYYDYPIRIYLQAAVKGGIKIDSLLESARFEWNGDGIQIDNVTKGNLVLVMTNGFPLNLNMNLYFQDENYQNIDTLLFGEFLPGGMLDENQGVSEPVETRISIPLDNPLKESIRLASYSFYELLINSAQGEHVVIHSSDFVRFKVIGDFTYLFEQ
jgi:hypothetical protein